MFMHSFVVSGQEGLLRRRHPEVFWLLSGVQIPVMRDTLLPGEAEFVSGYDCFGDLSLYSKVTKLARRVSLASRDLISNQSPRLNHRERITL